MLLLLSSESVVNICTVLFFLIKILVCFIKTKSCLSKERKLSISKRIRRISEDYEGLRCKSFGIKSFSGSCGHQLLQSLEIVLVNILCRTIVAVVKFCFLSC